MSLALTCQSGGNRVHGTHWRAACGKPATVVILYDQEVWHAGDVQEDILTSYPVCADHAAEEAHETRQCMAEDEFLVVDLAAGERLAWRLRNVHAVYDERKTWVGFEHPRREAWREIASQLQPLLALLDPPRT